MASTIGINKLSSSSLKFRMITTAVYPAKIPTIGNETSIPPLMITINTPSANNNCTKDDLRMSNKFASVKNSELLEPINIENSTIAMISTVSLRRSNLPKFIYLNS